MTLTTGWVAYQVDFTPTGNRSDIEVNVCNNAASIMTADIDDAEVYAVGDDVTAAAEAFSFSHGANFEGGLAAGQCTLRLKNDTLAYTGAVASTALMIGCPVYARATYAGVPYGLFYGIVKRYSADALAKMVDVFGTDPVDGWQRSAEISVAISSTRSVSAFRGAILDALGEPAARRNLTLFEHEADIPVITGSDAADALTLLGTLDDSTATIGYLLFDPSPSVLYRYTTIARNARSSQATDQTITDTFTGIGYEVNEDVNVTDQRVSFTTHLVEDTQTVWTLPDLPITVANGEVRTIWASYPNPTFNAALTYTATNGPTVDFTGFASAAKIVITGTAGGNTMSDLHIDGNPATAGDAQSVFRSSAAPGDWTVRGVDIDASYAVSQAAADGLAYWTVYRLGSFEPRVDLEVSQMFPTEVARQIGDRIVVQVPRVDTASRSELIRTVSTEISNAGASWSTTYGLEPAGIPAVGGVFILDTTPLDNATQKLGF